MIILNYMSGKKLEVVGKTGIKYRRKKQYLINILGGKCEKCNSTDNLVFHHSVKAKTTKNGKRGGYLNLLDIEKILSKDNGRNFVLLLCENCHILFHSEFGNPQLEVII
ncbi:MAG: hypothetical protein PHW73_04820 [Atribacterota bacterium]|nr:hypothetical protein [Atribacterota bacterium]